MFIPLQLRLGKRTPSTSVAVKVDEKQSPLPHVIDKRTGTKYLVDTGAEVSIVRPTRYDYSFRSFERPLFAANRSPIATYGNKPTTLNLGHHGNFSWIFVVAEVKYNIIGSDFLSHFGMIIDFNKQCLVFDEVKHIPLVFNMVSRIEYPISFISENKFSEILLNYPEVTQPHHKLNKVKHKVTHKIVFEGYPCSAKVRQLPPEKLKCARRELEELLEAGIIQRSSSPFASALHMVPKSSASGNTFRLCGDYRQVNKGTIPDRYPVPNIQTLLYRLGGASIFSKVDLVKAYHQIPMDDNSIAMTAITTPFGLFEYLYMPFGLRNASATFQRFIDHILEGMPSAIAYVDNIIVFSKTPEDHIKDLNELFTRLRNFGVIINSAKSQFGVPELHFLGHLVTANGIKPSPIKVEAIQKYNLPKDIKQLRTYLGMINFYHRFIKDLAYCLAPLNEFLKKEGDKKSLEITWNEDARTAFQKSKELLANSTLLVYPNENCNISILADASDIAVGAVLQQELEGTWQPIAFFSRKLDKTQQHYSAFDRELFAAYAAIRHFQHFVEGRNFTLFSDHKPFVHAFYSHSEPTTPRRSRQLSYISEFTSDVRHIRGDNNLVADALSRIQINNLHIFQEGLDYHEIAKAQPDDNFITSLLDKSSRSSLKVQEVRLDNSDVVLFCDVSTPNVRPIIPQKFRKVVFDKVHGTAHPGIKATLSLIQKRFVWHNMKKNVKEWAKCCDTCQKGKIYRHNKSPLGHFNIPSGRFENIHVDIVGPLIASNGYRYILTAIDRFSRWFTATPMRDITAEITMETFMNGWIQHFGCPLTVVTDQGSQFTSHLWKSYMKILGIKHITTTSYHPQSNGIVENVHRRLKDALRMQKFPQQWYYNLPIVMLVLHTTIKEELHCSPAELVLGQDLRLPGEFKIDNKSSVLQRNVIFQNLKKFIQELKPIPPKVHKEVHSYLDKNLQHCKFVLVRNDALQPPLSLRFSGPFEVIKRYDKYFILKDSKTGNEKSISIDRLKAYHSSPEQVIPAQSDDESSTIVPLVSEDNSTSPVCTRSGRKVRPPQRLMM